MYKLIIYSTVNQQPNSTLFSYKEFTFFCQNKIINILQKPYKKLNPSNLILLLFFSFHQKRKDSDKTKKNKKKKKIKKTPLHRTEVEINRYDHMERANSQRLTASLLSGGL